MGCMQQKLNLSAFCGHSWRLQQLRATAKPQFRLACVHPALWCSCPALITGIGCSGKLQELYSLSPPLKPPVVTQNSIPTIQLGFTSTIEAAKHFRRSSPL